MLKFTFPNVLTIPPSLPLSVVTSNIAGFSKSKNNKPFRINRINIAFDTPHLLFALREKARLAAWNAIQTSSTPMLLPAVIESTMQKSHCGTAEQEKVKSNDCTLITPCSSPELTPRKDMLIKEEESMLLDDSNVCSRQQKHNNNKHKCESLLPAKKRSCVRRSEFGNKTEKQSSPLDMLSGIAVLLNMRNEKGQ
mmetsp:Transcript_2643/g.3846  ORF Transcript_2643/g.3846 Transcript_2643/m.3846 type:complete len:195 (-) Transcript_2643:571-1155(-)